MLLKAKDYCEGASDGGYMGKLASASVSLAMIDVVVSSENLGDEHCRLS